MPVYQYRVVNSNLENEILEIEQALNEKELKVHPITGEAIKRVLTIPALILKHSTASEKKSLDPANLTKNGFTVFQKDKSNSMKYTRTAGVKGPEEINLV
jgi:predicted nucleic acid-binding Zn ribbon protein